MFYYEKIFHTVTISCLIGFFSSVTFAQDNKILDRYKTIIKQKPYTVEVCKEVAVSGDKTADTLMGAIIGGAIGNNVTKNVDNGGAVGALLGGMIANQNSGATGGTKTQCQKETRYEEEQHEIYSHSIIIFWYEGKKYSLQFNK
jgi:uncharacterized protein YcfJ